MALSVLVALMMLAVPLASSSNLFVDGGQTNSNGDAPIVSGDTSYRVDFILNEGSEGRISLDQVSETKLDDLIVALNNASNSPVVSGATWYKDKNSNIFAVVTGDVTIQQLIWALTDTSGADKVFKIEKTGYILDSFENNDTKAAFGPDKQNNAIPSSNNGDKITKDMTFTAKWLLDDSKYAEIPVDVVYEGETKEYVKAFPKYETVDTNIDEKNVYITVSKGSFLNVGIDDLNTYGIVVNANDSEDKITEIYTFKTTYGDNKEISKEISSKAVKVPVTSKLTMTYTFNDKEFSKIIVNSIAFNKEIFKDGSVTLYASKLRSYSYADVYNALSGADSLANETNAGKLTYDLPILDVTDDVTKDGYKLTGWNEGAELLKSENNASSPLTLDAKLNGYYVIFMVNGQFEYVYVPFGELSADKTTLDISGVNHWVSIDYTSYKAGTFTAIKSFNFASTSDVGSVEDVTGRTTEKEPTAVLIACFTPSSSTSYAVFNANSYTYKSGDKDADDGNDAEVISSMVGTFGNEYVNYLIIPGKSGDKITVPSIKPIYGEESKTLFISWNKYPAKITKVSDGAAKPNYTYPAIETAYSEKDAYGAANEVILYAADAVDYKYIITFYDGSEVVGVFYYSAAPTTNIESGLVAWEIDGKAYSQYTEESSKAFAKILTPEKDGYYITQWNDADKNKDVEFKWADGKISSMKVNIKDMKDDLNLYAQFKAEKYDIVYTNTYGNVGSMSQTASVDESVKLYSDSTFVYDGYKLTGWSDRPDGSGTNYDLGASFTLNGAQYEDLKDGKFTLYAVWEKVGSDVPGGNTDGNNDSDNTALYLIAGMLAVIAILAIVGIVLMRRK